MATTDAGTYAEDFGAGFQFHILAVCARTPGFVLRFRSALDHTFFSTDVDRQIAKALFGHIDQFGDLPHPTTLQEAVRTNAHADDMDALSDALGDLYEEDITDVKAVEAQAIKFGKTQAMVNAVVACAEELDQGNRHKIIPIIQEAELVGEDLLDLGVEFAKWKARREWYLASPEEQREDLIATGLPHLDYSLDGGPGRGELCCILAPPGRGKTTMLINIGFGAMTRATPETLTARRGFNVVHLSLEMHQDLILRRYDDRLAGEGIIKKKKVAPEQYVAHLDRQMPKVLGNLYVKSYPTRTLTPTKIRSFLTLLASQGFPVDVLIVDYGDIMQAERRIGDMRHEQAGIYEDLRTIAGEFNCVVWTGSQATRGALEKDTVTIADFAEAFEKAAICDGVFGFCQTEAERASHPQECRIFIAKYRNQEDGRTIYATIRRDCCRIRTAKLVDPAKGPIPLPDDADDDDDGERRTTTVHRADDKATPTEVAHGLKVRFTNKKARPTRTTKRKPGAPPRKRDRPSKQVGGA